MLARVAVLLLAMSSATRAIIFPSHGIVLNGVLGDGIVLNGVLGHGIVLNGVPHSRNSYTEVSGLLRDGIVLNGFAFSNVCQTRVLRILKLGVSFRTIPRPLLC